MNAKISNESEPSTEAKRRAAALCYVLGMFDDDAATIVALAIDCAFEDARAEERVRCAKVAREGARYSSMRIEIDLAESIAAAIEGGTPACRRWHQPGAGGQSLEASAACRICGRPPSEHAP